MSRTPIKKQAGQTVDEMAAQLMESSARNRVNRMYPDVAADVKREALAAIVNQQRELLHKSKERGRRIDLDDLDEVEKCVNDYLESCVKANCFPTMMGFAAAAGWSRMSIYRYINTSKKESARYLDNLRSSWAAIMAQMALTRQASEAVSIFLLKNSGQDLTDRVELTAIPAAQNDEELMSAEEIKKRYLSYFDDEEEKAAESHSFIIDNEHPEGYCT